MREKFIWNLHEIYQQELFKVTVLKSSLRNKQWAAPFV